MHVFLIFGMPSRVPSESSGTDSRRHAWPAATESATVYTLTKTHRRNYRQEYEKMYLQIAIVILLTLINGLLAISELAIVSAPRG